jgi:hypothetical protein
VTVTAQDMAHCVDTMNTYRGSVGKPAMTRDPKLEQIATRAAEQDYQAGVPHQHWTQTGGEGYSMAENEFVTSASHYGRPSAAIDFGIQLFWGEGPSGQHYQNIVNSSRAGCGYFLDGDNLMITADFR